MSETTVPNAPRSRGRAIIRFLGICAALLVVLVVLGPWIVAKTGLRDAAINAILASPSVQASSQRASFGWFSPLSVDGLELKSSNNRIRINVKGITFERSPWQLLASTPELGTISLDSPHIHLQLPFDLKVESTKHLEPTFKAVIRNAALTVRAAELNEPVIDVDDINLSLRVEAAEGGRLLTLDPMVVFDRRKLSPRLASNLLHLINPTIGDAPQVTGEVSLSLAKFRIPLGVPRDQMAQRIEVEGKLGLHQITAEVKNPINQALVQLLADLHDKQASEVVRVVQDAEVNFQVREGRLYHEGLRLGFPKIDPDLVVSSRGSVGLDKTLDLQVELPRLDPLQRKEKGPVKCRITGTTSNPKIAVQDGSLVLRQPDRKEPFLAVDGINLNMEVETTAAGRVLAIQPVEIFKKEKLSPGLVNGLVHWVLPDIAGDRQVGGDFSMSFQKLRIPLGVTEDQRLKRLEAEGMLTLHQVAVEAKYPVTQALVKVLADMHGKPAANLIRLVDDAEINFQVKDGRLHHDGLRLGFPEIDPNLVVKSSGSIGLDETLDLNLELPRLDKTLRKEKGPAKCRITGTIHNPKISVQDASLVVRMPDRKEPILDVTGLNLNMQVMEVDNVRVLALEPVEVFKKAKLNVALSSGLVHLVEPDLAGNPQISGEMSLAIDNLHLPLAVAKDQFLKHLEVEGKLTLHQVSSEAKNPVRLALVKFLADMYGKQASDVVRVIQDAEVKFQVRNGRLFHEGLRFGFPEIDPELVIKSSGSIGLDETLDLKLELPRLLKNKQSEQGPIQCHITGTISDPKISLLGASLMVHIAGGAKPTLTVHNLDLTFSVESSKDGRILSLAPVTICQKQKVSPEMGDEFLRLVAPSLDDLSGVNGELSLSLQTFRVPLGAPLSEVARRAELVGRLELHNVSASIKSPLLEAMIKVLADMHGKKPSEVVRVIQDAAISFQIRNGRMYHEGLRIGFPDISPDLLVTSRGSIGLDHSLDLVLEVPRIVVPGKVALADPKIPVRFRIMGTIEKPVVTEIKQK